jgi:hypothetical protein
MIHLVVVDEPAQVPRRAAHEPVYGTVDEHDHLSHDHASTVSAPRWRRRTDKTSTSPEPHRGAEAAAARRRGEGQLDQTGDEAYDIEEIGMSLKVAVAGRTGRFRRIVIMLPGLVMR